MSTSQELRTAAREFGELFQQIDDKRDEHRFLLSEAEKTVLYAAQKLVFTVTDRLYKDADKANMEGR